MSLILNLFKKTLKFPSIWIGVIYLFWWIFIPTNESFYEGIVFLVVYSAITILETLLGTNKKLFIIFFIVLLPFTWFFSLMSLILWSSTAGWLGREFIYIPLIIFFSSYIAHKLLQESSSANKTLRILLFIATLPILAISIAYPISCFPKVLDQKEFGNSKYYIVWGIDRDFRSYLSFYKCGKWSFRCNDLYSGYSQQNFDKIIIDKEKNEVSAARAFDLGLAYTDGANPRSYDAFSVQLGDHAYQPSIDYKKGDCGTTDCDVYIYTIYECSLDYTSCHMLPMRYTATSDVWIYLDVNEITKEINAYDRNDTVIYTYGAHPVCHIDGCVIPDQ